MAENKSTRGSWSIFIRIIVAFAIAFIIAILMFMRYGAEYAMRQQELSTTHIVLEPGESFDGIQLTRDEFFLKPLTRKSLPGEKPSKEIKMGISLSPGAPTRHFTFEERQ